MNNRSIESFDDSRPPRNYNVNVPIDVDLQQIWQVRYANWSPYMINEANPTLANHMVSHETPYAFKTGTPIFSRRYLIFQNF